MVDSHTGQILAAFHSSSSSSSLSCLYKEERERKKKRQLLKDMETAATTKKSSPESEATSLNFKETELTLGLPGGGGGQTIGAGNKRGFTETVDLKLGSKDDVNNNNNLQPSSETAISRSAKPPASKAQVVGWPPVRSFRKNVVRSCTYVKVAVDGAPYLRKVDLEMYTSYQELLTGLEQMFTCFTLRHHANESKLMDPVNGTEYVPTYEDKDGDWMLVGDVPWKMFVESCKRLRLMKSSEAMGLAAAAPRTPPKSTNLKS